MDEIAHHHPQKRKQGHDDDNAPSPDPIAPPTQDTQPTAARRADSKRPRIDTELPVVQTPRVDVTPTATATNTPSSSTPTMPGTPLTPSPPLSHCPSRLGRLSAKRRPTRAVASHAASSFIPYGHIHPATGPVPPEFKSSPYIPPSKPLINRATLRELELDVILRNPVIRHDLLFDPGLQFRPRRKAEAFERYWAAVWEEVQTGCTCVTLDSDGRLHTPKICICAYEPPSASATIQVHPPSAGAASTSRQLVLYTHRAPSRILPLLIEFLEVLLLVIQPLSNTAIYTDPLAIHDQAAEHSLHAAHLRAIFDPVLIAQEVQHGIWEPEGVFKEIGETLKCHCAPMRDGEVEALVRSASVRGEGMKAVKTCLELLELMKLDIANHQLSQLRPWLLRNTGIFEVKAFKLRFGSQDPEQASIPLSLASLHNTREWLHKSHDSLMLRKTPIPHHAYGSHAQSGLGETKLGSFRYKEDLTKNQKIYLAALKGVVDLVFDTLNPVTPFAPVLPGSSSSSSFKTRAVSLSSSKNSAYTYTPEGSAGAQGPIPETMYLDKSRLVNLGGEAGELTGLYMMVLLFRQMVFANPTLATRPQIRKEDTIRVKREVRDIAPVGFGMLLLSSAGVNDGSDDMNTHTSRNQERTRVREDLVLQLARRACDVRARADDRMVVDDVPSSLSSSSFPTPCMPDAALLSLGQSWGETNLSPASGLSQFLHNRVREAVFDAVVGLAWGGPGSANNASAGSSGSCNLLERGECAIKNYRTQAAGSYGAFGAGIGMGLGAGMEPLHEDVYKLAEKIARLALVHLNTHLPMYEQEGFFFSRNV